jgi:DNA-binding NtrC family response regulator
VGRLGGGAGAIEIGAYAPGEHHEEHSEDAAGGEGGEDARVEEAVDSRVVVFRPGMTIEEMERKAIAAALEEVRGNRRKAAELLGIGERTLYRKIAKYEMEA